MPRLNCPITTRVLLATDSETNMDFESVIRLCRNSYLDVVGVLPEIFSCLGTSSISFFSSFNLSDARAIQKSCIDRSSNVQLTLGSESETVEIGRASCRERV